MKGNKLAGRNLIVILAIVLCIASAAINYFTNQYYLSRLSGTGALNIFLLSTVFGNSLYTYTMPLIGSIAYSYWMYQEINGGYAYNKILTSSHRRYFCGHYYKAMLYGGFVAFAGMVIWLGVSVMIDGSAAYRIIDVYPGTAFSEIYDKSMLLYVVCVICNNTLFSALYSAFSTGLYMAARNIATAIIVPPLFYVLSTLSFGGYSLFGAYILPFSTVIFQNITIGQLLKDHMLILLLSIVLYVFGVKKWQRSAS